MIVANKLTLTFENFGINADKSASELAITQSVLRILKEELEDIRVEDYVDMVNVFALHKDSTVDDCNARAAELVKELVELRDHVGGNELLITALQELIKNL